MTFVLEMLFANVLGILCAALGFLLTADRDTLDAAAAAHRARESGTGFGDDADSVVPKSKSAVGMALQTAFCAALFTLPFFMFITRSWSPLLAIFVGFMLTLWIPSRANTVLARVMTNFLFDTWERWFRTQLTATGDTPSRVYTRCSNASSLAVFLAPLFCISGLAVSCLG